MNKYPIFIYFYIENIYIVLYSVEHRSVSSFHWILVRFTLSFVQFTYNPKLIDFSILD